MQSLTAIANGWSRALTSVGLGATALVFMFSKSPTIATLGGNSEVLSANYFQFVLLAAAFFVAYALGELFLLIGKSWLPRIPRSSDVPDEYELIRALFSTKDDERLRFFENLFRTYELFCGLFSLTFFILMLNFEAVWRSEAWMLFSGFFIPAALCILSAVAANLYKVRLVRASELLIENSAKS